MAKIEPVVNVNSISRISAGTVIKGEILSPTDIRIDGTFEGKVTSHGRVVLGESAIVKGDIVCDSIDLWGKVEGNLYVKDTLSLKEGCEVNGNLHIRRLAVELGATFNGSCHTITEAEFNKLSGVAAQPVAQSAAQPAQKSQAHAN
jgi:cytoskeletal protein CcmA (bactofilin family)